MPVPSHDTGKGGDFKLLPAGIHAACCDQVISVGLQNITWAGKAKVQPKVFLRFEVPQERLEYEKDGQNFNRPMSIGVMLTNSLSEKATLRKFLESWRGREFSGDELKNFDLMQVLGKPCMLTVEHNEGTDKTYANIKAISRFFPEIVVAGNRVPVKEPVAEMPLLAYDPDHEPAAYDKLPDWLRKKVDERVHPEAAATPAAPETAADDFKDSDIPF